MRFDLLLWAVATGALQIFIQNVESQAVSPLGTLDYDSSALKADFSSEIGSITPGAYCIGTKDIPAKECFTYVEINDQLQGEFVVYVDADNSISELTFLPGLDGLSLRVQKVVANVLPNLKPFFTQQKALQPATQKVTRKRVVEDENGEKVEVEEVEEVEVDNRSWVQKNWMYIVPALLLVFIMSPEEKSGEQKA